MGARIAKSFVVGAVLGLVVQVLLTICGMIFPADLALPIAMLLFGLLSMVFILSGVLPKFLSFGGDGANIALCGMMLAAAGMTAEEKAKGASSGKAFLKGFFTIISILAIGFALCFVLGLILK